MDFKGKNLIILVLSFFCLVLIGYLIYSNPQETKKGFIPAQEAGELAIGYINKNLLSEGSQANLTGEVEEEGGVYKFQIEIGGQKYFSYITKDGKILFAQGINLEETAATSQGGGEQASPKSCEDLPKNDKPVLEAFVVSYCPFGTQMQRILNEIVKEIPSLAQDIKISYIGEIKDGKVQAMHGEEEAEENLRQICLREEQKDKFYSYLSCFIKEGKTEGCLGEVGADKEGLSQCMTDSSRGITYAQEDFEAQNTYRVTGSPTLILNEEAVSEFDFGGRTAQAVKTLLCCGFTSEPELCGKTLSEEQAATGFSKTYSSGNPSSDASCGQ